TTTNSSSSITTATTEATSSVTSTISVTSVITTSSSISASTTILTNTTFAMYNTLFVETGLLSGSAWSISYNGIVQAAVAPNSIIFSTPPGNYVYFIPSITVNGISYAPSLSGGLLAAGGAITIAFTGIPITTTSTASSTTSSSTTLSSTTTIQMVPTIQNQYLNRAGNGKYNGIVYVSNNTVSFSLKGSPLEGVHTDLLKNNIELNITVVNQTQAPQQIKFSLSPVYQYIQINGTIVGSSANIDS